MVSTIFYSALAAVISGEIKKDPMNWLRLYNGDNEVVLKGKKDFLEREREHRLFDEKIARMAEDRAKSRAEHNAWKARQAQLDAEASLRNEKATRKEL